MEPNYKNINRGYRKRKGRLMFPTSHDITSDPEVEKNCFKVLEKLLLSGNEILLTTKPNLTVVQHILFKFKEYKNQVQFRFTITSLDDKRLRFWEPNAPTYFERKRALNLAFSEGWKTSVSIEPFLDPDPIFLIKEIEEYCSETIWIGLMSNVNHVVGRGIWEIQQIPHDPTTKENAQIEDIRNYIKEIYEINQFNSVQKIVNNLHALSEPIKARIRLKNSITKLYAKKGVKLPTMVGNKSIGDSTDHMEEPGTAPPMIDS